MIPFKLDIYYNCDIRAPTFSPKTLTLTAVITFIPEWLYVDLKNSGAGVCKVFSRQWKMSESGQVKQKRKNIQLATSSLS